MEERTLEGIKYKVEDALTELAQKKDINNSDLEVITRLLCVLEQIGRVGGSSSGNAYDNSYTVPGELMTVDLIVRAVLIVLTTATVTDRVIADTT